MGSLRAFSLTSESCFKRLRTYAFRHVQRKSLPPVSDRMVILTARGSDATAKRVHTSDVRSSHKRPKLRMSSHASHGVESTHTLHEQKIPTFLDSFRLRRNDITFIQSQFPRDNGVESLLSSHIIAFRMNNLAVSEVYPSFLLSAPYQHATGVASDANELNDIVQARIGDCTAEPRHFQPLCSRCSHSGLGLGNDLISMLEVQLLRCLRPIPWKRRPSPAKRFRLPNAYRKDSSSGSPIPTGLHGRRSSFPT